MTHEWPGRTSVRATPFTEEREMETTVTTPSARPLRPGRIVAASLVGLVALLILAAAGTGLWYEAAKPDHGYISSGTHRYAAQGSAIVSDSMHVGSFPDWLVAKVRVASSSASGKPTFVGIGRKADVDRYLAGVAHSTIEDLNFGGFDVSYGKTPGSTAPARPDTQHFWAASAEGAGTQAVSWRLRSGHWRVVVMNADASPRVVADAKVAATFRGELAIAISILAVGLAFGAVALALGVSAARRS
jgi:hypothetical protein